MKIPVLDEMMSDMTERGDTMQETLDDIKDLLVQIELNTRVLAQARVDEIRFKG